MIFLKPKNGLHFSCIFSSSHNIFSTFSSTCLRVKFKNQLRIDAIFLHFLWLQALAVEKNLEKIQKSAKKKNRASGGVFTSSLKTLRHTLLSKKRHRLETIHRRFLYFRVKNRLNSLCASDCFLYIVSNFHCFTFHV